MKDNLIKPRMSCRLRCPFSPDNRSAVLYSIAHTTTISHVAAHMRRDVWESVFWLLEIAITVGDTCDVRAACTWTNVFCCVWATALKFWSTILLVWAAGIRDAMGTCVERWITLLELLGGKKSSTRSPNPIQCMKMPRFMKVWLHLIQTKADEWI